MTLTTDGDTLKELRNFIQRCPVIDNHAHNILRSRQLKSADFLTISTEASGQALEDTRKSLSHLRAVKQLRTLYELPEDADWPAIVGKRIELLERDADALMKRCFEGTATILVDDGLDSGENIESYSWHDKYTHSACKRIVRIETLAADILSDLHQQGKLPIGVAIADEEACSLGWVSFITQFEQAILAALSDDEVVGFKSVICYRTGLDVLTGRDFEVTEEGLRSFRKHFLPDCVTRNFRVEAKGMNDALVISACKLIAAEYTQRGVAKPLQFHTGLGDNDINLLDSNPACLQPLITAFPTVPIVLLHSSYPYTREAGYLATVYKNVYLDIGEVFPMVSRTGQEQIARQAFELTPFSKVLWSTDGHHFPETYWLANLQGRQALERVFCELVKGGDLSVPEARDAVADVLYNNSNGLYGLHLPPPAMGGSAHSGPSEPNRLSALSSDRLVCTYADHHSRSHLYSSPIPGLLSTSLGKWETDVLQQADNASSLPTDLSNKDGVVATKGVSDVTPYDLDAMFNFEISHLNIASPDNQLVLVQWLDHLATIRSKLLPWKYFNEMVHAGSRFGITYGNLGTLQNDHVSPVCSPVGQVYVQPDLTTLKVMHMQPKSTRRWPLHTWLPTATVMASLTDGSGSPIDLCPRYQLQRLSEAIRNEHGIYLLVGFEIEITFSNRVRTYATLTPDTKVDLFAPFDSNHAWGTMTDEQYMNALPLLSEVFSALKTIGVEVQQLHSESGAGQYEVVLAPMSPVRAVDTLIQTRQCIQQVAATRGLRATCHPMPFPGIGTAAHAHISLNSQVLGDEELQSAQMSFMAAVLEHLPAVCAFSMPQAESYCRVVDDAWTGGTWIAWGTQNREVPLRRVPASSEGSVDRWEVRCMDGTANMYLALGAILGAGLTGMRDGANMSLMDCQSNPTKLSTDEKRALGISRRMPTTIQQATDALDGDEDLQRTLNPGLVKHYVAMKRAEQEMLEEMSDRDRRVWLIERY